MSCKWYIFRAFESHIPIKCVESLNEMYPNQLQAPTQDLPNLIRALMYFFHPHAISAIQDDLQFPDFQTRDVAFDFDDLVKNLAK